MKEDYEYIQQKVICEDGNCNVRYNGQMYNSNRTKVKVEY